MRRPAPTRRAASSSRRRAAISERLAQILPQRPAAVIVLLTGKGTELFEQSAPQLERAVALRTNAPEVPESERLIPMIMLGVPVVGLTAAADGLADGRQGAGAERPEVHARASSR